MVEQAKSKEKLHMARIQTNAKTLSIAGTKDNRKQKLSVKFI